MIWYKQKIEELYETFETSEDGLSNKLVVAQRKKYGSNQLAVKKEPFWRLLIEPFRSVFVAVLGAAAIISLLSHEPLDAVIIGGIILINSVIFYTQQYATTRVLRSLKKHSIQRVTVLRNDEQVVVSSVELVPGDIILLAEGEKIPADARVVDEDGLQLNEASLTGESVPVYKHVSVLATDKQLYEQDNMVFQGTYVTAGTGKALVVETGNRTEYGKIAQLATSEHSRSPVQLKIDRLVTLLIKVIGLMAVVVFMLSLYRGIPADEALRFVMSMAVSAVPEGLPVALTVIIVLGMRRMAKQKALVRSFKAIEDIGQITTIATDKTGTLTKNHLSVVDTWAPDSGDITQIAYLTLDPEAKLSDPLDIAITEIMDHPRRHQVDKLYSFDIALRMSGSYIAKDRMIYLKGSPEHILAKSKVTTAEHRAAESAMHEMASKGYRVIAIGTHKVTGLVPADLSVIKKNDIDFVGYLAFADELRPEVVGAIRQAKQAGITVRLITGDHYETAFNIGKKIGLATHPDQVIQGTDLPKNQRALALAVHDKTIFARILPEDKFRILKALKQTEITAMTGDGVNDVPALSNAHVGIAMGSGSDIARDASGIVLLNDNFATIIKAVAEGRKIFDNIRRMVFYLLSTSLGEVMTMVGALILGLPLPLTAIQILWINLVTDTAMVLPLGLEPAEDGHMKRPPRQPKDPLLSKMLLRRMVLVAVTMAVITLVIVAMLRAQGESVAYVQTVAFMALISAQWINAFNARSEFASSFSRLKNANHGLTVGFLVAFSLQMLAMFGPLSPVLGVEQVSLTTLLVSCGVMMVAVLAVVEVHKFIVRKNMRVQPVVKEAE